MPLFKETDVQCKYTDISDEKIKLECFDHKFFEERDEDILMFYESTNKRPCVISKVDTKVCDKVKELYKLEDYQGNLNVTINEIDNNISVTSFDGGMIHYKIKRCNRGNQIQFQKDMESKYSYEISTDGHL